MDNQETLRGAKIIASRNKEYWDNRQGGHTQRIYTEDAVEEIKNWTYHIKGWRDHHRPGRRLFLVS